MDEAATLFSALNIAATGEHTLNELEWRGRLNGPENQLEAEHAEEDVLDSDDETEMDPLRLIAQRRLHERKVQILPAEPQLITAEDLQEIKSFQMETTDSGLESYANSTNNSDAVESGIEAELIELNVEQLKPKLQNMSAHSSVKEHRQETDVGSATSLDQHGCYLVNITETNVQTATREKFKPYQTTVSNVHDPQKEKHRKQGKHWEITAATPPPIQHNGTQMISLMDSVDTQAKYLAKLKVTYRETLM